MPLSQVFQIMKEEQTNVTLDEVKSLFKYVNEKSGIASQAISSGDEIDINDLVNVVMDVSLQINNKDESMVNVRYS